MKNPSHLAVLLLLASAACRPDAPATEPAAPTAASQAAPPAASVPAPKPSAATAASPTSHSPADTLHLPGGRVVQLLPTTADAFNQLPTSTLPKFTNDPDAEPLSASQGLVRREGLDLLLQPAQGNAVKLSSTPEAEFTLQNGNGVKFIYWGNLAAAHQWVVQAVYWEENGIVLVDQRTGRSVELTGEAVASPDGRFVFLTSPGLGGGDQPNVLSLVQIDAAGPRLLWQREPTAWAPVTARWATSSRIIIERRHTLDDGSMADDAPVTYDELDASR
ncbi:hypothetical protein GCM10022409_19950 [Hymenobacter glaciei]|uniref:Dipeptidylpeptidase IV N-terminal domain-containing protein n=1 Tax=Hymenobacter glaciei TaxID=877209 RepID=A0ABP7U3B5_9BACT